MSFVNTATLLVNGLTIALALGFLLIILSQEGRKELNHIFAAFLFLVTMWDVGSLLTGAFSVLAPELNLLPLSISLTELGFTGASIAVYALSAVLVGVHSRRFRLLTFISLFIVLGYQVFLIVNSSPLPNSFGQDSSYTYRFQPITAAFYLIFDGTALYLIWRYRRKFRSYSLLLGLTMFILGQSLSFFNPELRITPLSTNLSSIAALLVSFAMLRQEIMIPLRERITQVQTLQRVSIAITSQIAIDTVLNQIATQAANWLDADGAGIFLNTGDELELATVYNLPKSYLNTRVKLGEGINGTAAQLRRTIHLENYQRDWKEKSDLPLANEVFGSVISIPLIYGNKAIGVLMVVAGRQGRLFQEEDIELLELLSSHAAVAIAHSQLFTKQQNLTKEVEKARNELETVLTSTENPVIAIDDNFRLIFANPAAKNLFLINEPTHTITDSLASKLIPLNQTTSEETTSDTNYIHEVEIDHKTYLCHTTRLRQTESQGWVAILNDITHLKELDRLKSEMVRMTSHDLKNPLQAAIANLELLTDDLSNNPNQEIHKSLSTINKQLTRMNRIINGILDLERVKSGKPNLTQCNPVDILHKIYDDFHELAAEQKIALHTIIEDNPPNLWANAEQIERALANLVENAIKFTPQHGKVTISLKQNQEEIIYEVQDTGIGIPQELQSQIFDRFLRGAQKGQAGAEHITGSGLGLSLVKTVIENHQGKVWLNSIVGEGTTFYISLPTTNTQALIPKAESQQI